MFARDKLPKQVISRPSAFVVNTDPATKPGQHWIGIHFTRDGVGEYFDSYGLPPQLPEFNNFLKNNSEKTQYNHQRLQGPLSAVCGQYSIYFLLHRCRGITMSIRYQQERLQREQFYQNTLSRIKTNVFDDQLFFQQVSRALLK